LYGPESYQAPNGYSLPYYLPLSGIFLPVQTGMDPYASTVQSPNLRVIESTVDPKYSAKTDVAELQFSLDLPHNLTVTSETGYSTDELFSLEDYNRFNTVPGAFNQEWWDVTIGGEPAFSNIYRHNLLNDGVFCDPQIGCTSRVVAVDTSTAASHQFSQEFRLSSSFEGAFNFSLGANFLRYDTVDKYYVFINTLTLMAAISPYGRNFALPDYEPNASDNLECMHTGIVPPDFTKVQELAYCTYIDPNPVGSLNDMGHNYFLSKNPYKLISYAVFGEAYYNITPNLKVTAGLRWTVDKKEAPRIPSWILASDSVGYPVLEVVHQTWREPTGRLTIDWKPDLSFTDETLLYASYAHGYKAGGANPPPTGIVMYCGECGANATASTGAIRESAAKPKIFNPEYVDAFELGSKNTLLDGRMTLNATVFYYDYRGYQISQIIDRSAVNYNFDSKVWGAEIEADWRPLENLRLGFKGGYERTRIANGMKAIDIMDRTAGHDDWVVVRPFPTFASNCILPLNTVVQDGTLRTGPNVFYNGNPGPCEFTYIMNLDPVTALPYVPDPTERDPSFGWLYPGYHGFNPETAPNHGEGFDKDLSGHELPNAPHFTATITGDYTVPLPNDWLVTLHTDLYYQSEAWTRVFNTPGYDKLKAYTNVNLAAIFSNEERGWQVMAYIKNVLDKDNITGAFLNSDDTGLTTNVFLNEPRLYGLRVTKNWTGAEWWGGGRTHAAGQPYTFTVELGGQVQRQDAPYAPLSPSFAGAFSSTLNALNRAQNRDLDWGDGREVRVTYRPGASGWSVSAGVRYGRTNSDTARLHLSELAGDKKCGVPYSGYFETFAHLLCDPDYVKYPKPAGYYYEPLALKTGTNWSDTSARGHEEHTMADFAVGRDFGLGSLGRSEVTAGVRYADFKSDSTITFAGVPDYYLPVGWALYPSTRHRYNSSLAAERQFKGAGPAISVEGATPLIGNAQSGHVNLAWDVGAGVLFGRQKADIAGFESVNYNAGKYGQMSPTPADRTPVAFHRTKSVSVPVLDLSLGLSYEIERVKVGAGYRWERYYNAIDGGFAEHKSYDRTLDGPYFKVAVGFGG
ncbi:MAG: TonB-dependent receptor domain-containing protein, partial [Ignavibacteriales bacterium]